MPFLSISFANIRNLENATIDLLAKEVYFVGENGQGKTNILEAVYLSSYGSSFRTQNDSEIIAHDQSDCSIRSLFKDQAGHTQTIAFTLRDGRKKIERNAKVIQDRKDLVHTIPCVLYCHDDLDFAIGAPERRRFFVDQSLSMYDPDFIDVLRSCKKILKTKGALLKEKRADLLDVVDSQLAEIGLKVIHRRRKTLLDFNGVFTRLYEEVTGIDGVKIEYGSSWKGETSEEVMIELIDRRSIELTMGICMSGPQRDRIRFVRKGTAFIPTASTGQRRLLSLLLRTAQATFYTEKTGRLPVLLMDDVLLELDPEKRQRFTALLPEYDQLFCTFLPGEPYERYRRSGTKVYNVEGGSWRE